MREIPQRFFDGKLHTFQEKFPDVFPKFIFSKLKKSTRENEDVCKLYRIQGTNVVAVVPKKDYLLTLEEILVSFTKLEEYELAAECRDLINEYQVNQVIEETKGRPDEH